MKLIDEATATGERLSEATDTLRAKLALAEAKLAATKLGVTASVPLFDHAGAPLGELVWSKVGAAWAFRWRTGATTIELLRAPKEVRVRGSLAMGALLDALIREGERQLVEMTAAVKTMDEWIIVFAEFEKERAKK